LYRARNVVVVTCRDSDGKVAFLVLSTRGHAAWLYRHRIAVLVVSLLVVASGVMVGRGIPIRGDLGALLPPSEASVRDLARLNQRVRPFGTVQVVIEAPDPALRARAATQMRQAIAALPRGLVAMFSPDDGAQLRYGWQHRFLFASLDDLAAARDALQARVDHARLAANPLYIELDDDKAADDDGLAKLETRLDKLEHDAKTPPPRASEDGTIELFTIQTAFGASDDEQSAELVGMLEKQTKEIEEALPGVEIGLSGNVVRGHLEHRAVLAGMTRSILITVVLCALGLLYYYRSIRVVLAILWALAAGVTATFAIARGVVGHLDMMSAFLAAIVIGNGINAGLIFTARVLEELRDGRVPSAALERAISGAMRGTIAAAATAFIGYASLIVTDFRGFRNFGIIAAIGMAMTWLATFTVLPAALAVFAERGWLRARAEPAIGRVVARLFARRPRVNLAIGSAAVIASLALAIGFIARDPFTRDWRDLQSTTSAIEHTQEIDAKARAAQGTTNGLTASAFQIVFATPDAATAEKLVADLNARKALFREARSLADFLPSDQPVKLGVLAEIRRMIDSPDVSGALTPDELTRVRALRPPEDLRALTLAEVPEELAWPYIERDGTRGRLVLARGKSSYEPYDMRGRREFAASVRQLQLPAGTIGAGEALVIADIVDTMERDAPVMILVALLGSLLAVTFVLGWTRQAWVTIGCGLAGVIAMVAVCALVGLRVHFIDLVALPLTIGIGIEYAANLAARDAVERTIDPGHLLRTTGSAVVLCSYTTAVGYATLLLSANGGVKAFGLAALIGEITCLAMALAIAPAALALLRERRRTAIQLRSAR
jgi:hypothetical protein